jgi:hypothetical protein
VSQSEAGLDDMGWRLMETPEAHCAARRPCQPARDARDNDAATGAHLGGDKHLTPDSMGGAVLDCRSDATGNV